MDAEQELSSAPQRPDLDEFLSALGGFLDKQSATPSSTKDPSYLRFLSMFCRSVGAGEGHFLKRVGAGSLESIISFGLGAKFDDEFNRAYTAADAACPLDEVRDKKEVVAIVELQKDPSLPPWFMKFMNKFGLKSMVAVPLIGQGGVTGILCAYYKDICLFDQNTLDHLMMIGRMVGAATEKSMEAERATSLGLKDKVLDEFLDVLTRKKLSPVQVYQHLVDLTQKVAPHDGLLAGPARKTSTGLSITVAATAGLPQNVIAQRFNLPTGLAKGEWGELASLVKNPSSAPTLCPFVWQGQLVGALVGWRKSGSLDPDDALLVSRLVRAASLAAGPQ